MKKRRAFRIRPICIPLAAALACAFAIFAATARPEQKAGGEAGSFALPSPVPFTIGKTGAHPGTLYSISTSAPGDVVYLAGNLPIIISVPHGGSANPGIPDRKGSWGFINKNDDAGTIELALDLVRALGEKTGGKFPHVIINNISRAKIDQNREWGGDGNPTAGRGSDAWKDFHERFTGSVAIPAVLDTFGTGLFIDLHGKPDGYGSDVIIGYNLTASNLSNSDGHLNTSKKNYADKSSLRFLSRKLGKKIAFAELMRGNTRGHESFGSLLQRGLDEMSGRYKKKFTAVPRHDYRKPLLNLSGGYNLRAFCGVKDGSIDNPYRYTESRFISGFQLEVSRELRTKSPLLRKDFARKVADAVTAYLERNFSHRIGRN